MSGTDHALRLMIVDDSVEDAEAIVSTLRNAGIAVRPLRPDSAESLAEMLADQAVDLVLAAQGATTEIGSASCRERVCQYVSISVVAVAIKKKTKRHHDNSAHN